MIIGKSLSLIYHDNGVGFELQNIEQGMGLKNIASRAERLNAELTVESAPGKGSNFIIELAAT